AGHVPAIKKAKEGFREASLTRHKRNSNETFRFCLEYPLCVLALLKIKKWLFAPKKGKVNFFN
nr:hypothetical protein [Paludibacteraceae bacterium]